MRTDRLCLVVAGLLLVGALAACSAPLSATFPGPSLAEVPLGPPATRTTEIMPVRADVPRLQRSAVFECAGSPCDDPCPGPPPAPQPQTGWCPPPCVLACEQNRSEWHLRALAGYAFPLGDERGDGNLYLGADVGWTSKCCWGIDAFYRTHCNEFDREMPIVGAATLMGEDGGHFHHIGLKATYQRAFGNSRWYGYVGAGPQYFWTDGYEDDDTGWGFFGEAGVGFVLRKNWKLRAGVDVLGQSTSAGRLSPADDDDSRMLWFLSPVVALELSL